MIFSDPFFFSPFFFSFQTVSPPGFLLDQCGLLVSVLRSRPPRFFLTQEPFPLTYVYRMIKPLWTGLFSPLIKVPQLAFQRSPLRKTMPYQTDRLTEIAPPFLPLPLMYVFFPCPFADWFWAGFQAEERFSTQAFFRYVPFFETFAFL